MMLDTTEQAAQVDSMPIPRRQRICCTLYLYLSMSKSNLTHYLSNALFWQGKVTRAGENQFKHMKLQTAPSNRPIKLATYSLVEEVEDRPDF